MTKQEAGKQIDMLLEQKKERLVEAAELPEVNEPQEVDTDDAGLEGELL